MKASTPPPARRAAACVMLRRDATPEYELTALAKLSERGLHVSSPDDGDLDDVERERWDACVEIVKALSVAEGCPQ